MTRIVIQGTPKSGKLLGTGKAVTYSWKSKSRMKAIPFGNSWTVTDARKGPSVVAGGHHSVRHPGRPA